MACRGWFTALLLEESKLLSTSRGTDELLERLNSIYTPANADGRVLAVDKSWDAMHRVLCGGDLPPHGIGVEEEMRACVLGGNQLSNRNDWILSYVQPHMVVEVSARIERIDQPWFREQYFKLDKIPEGVPASWRYCLPLNVQDFEYTWSYFEEVRSFYKRAALRGLATLFSVNQ